MDDRKIILLLTVGCMTVALAISIYLGWIIPIMCIGAILFCLKKFLNLSITRSELHTVTETQSLFGTMQLALQQNANQSASTMMGIISADQQARDNAVLTFCDMEDEFCTKSLEMAKSAQKLKNKIEMDYFINQQNAKLDDVQADCRQRLRQAVISSNEQLEISKAKLKQEKEKAAILLQNKQRVDDQRLEEAFAKAQANLRNAGAL